MQLDLDDLIAKLKPQESAALMKEASAAVKGQLWLPNAGPQVKAYFSPADMLLYGGQGGGGKTDLLLGLAMHEHQRSLIMRREYTQMGALIERAIQINGTSEGLNRSSPPRLRTATRKLIEFGACRSLGDEQDWQGQPHDLIGFDEAVQFLEFQVRFIIGWNRPASEGDVSQRCRVVMATNPPISDEGQWIISMFRPWLDITHPNPAKDGELRWYVTDPDGKDMEVDGPRDIKEWDDEDGVKRIVIPRSRTFIPAALRDNPTLAKSGYQATLDALPEPMRSAVRDGNFMAARKDNAFQAIPSAWVFEAKKRWTPEPPENVPMCAMGVDASGGGTDPMIIAIRHDAWYAPMVVIPGKDIPMDSIGTYCSGAIVGRRRDNATVGVDMGGGYGSSTFERLVDNSIDAVAHKGAEKSFGRTVDGKLPFVNKRSEVIWRFREALDPDQPGGSPVALPDDPELTADLTAPTFKISSRGIQVESKEDVVARLGRSTDKGDAVQIAWSVGKHQSHVRGGFKARRRGTTKVVVSHAKQRRG